ncbi:putative rare lipoprotein a -like double-psi beta-barrel domain-containing [Golovinomyces cichoracearum]|uniref:Putative rare lipoprotein a-like double-psi beta-barrel domain-containing n=1 Tax=Golovinomyces cichoracearum TaxID=62708 RepID=A0A420IRL1_9PEZI|nr:putative rare lipoprotein a -like double-psi beta-barrel domain-containing [Golovinomyces cichoracearum]
MKSSIFATFIFFGSVFSSPHRHLHQHTARHPKQQDERPVTWVTEVVLKTVQVTSTVWVTPLAEPTHVLVEHPAAEVTMSAPNTPAQFFEPQPSIDQGTSSPEITFEKNDDTILLPEPRPSIDQGTPSSEIASEKNDDTILLPEPRPSTDKDTPPFIIAPEKSYDTVQSFEPQPFKDRNIPSSEIALEKSDQPNDEATIENLPSESITSSPVTPGENHEISETNLDEIKASEPSTPSESMVASSQIPSEASLASNNTAIHDHATAATCSPSSPCDGDITYYDPGVGYGACGWKNTKNEPVVALPHEFMGSKSNGNSYCGKTITIVRDGKKSTARVVDKCMGCTGYSIDLSDAVFTQLAALSVGRTSAKWWVN